MPVSPIRRRRLRSALTPLVLTLAWGAAAIPDAADAADTSPSAVTGTRPIRDREVAGEVPTISFIDSPTATCYRPQELSQICWIEWTYLYVAATAPHYITGMTVEIDGRLRANLQGFFQTDMFVPSGMYAPGFLVRCGQPGAGGDPLRGNQYGYTIRAAESGGLTTANYGSVLCPATRYIFADGFASGNGSAWSAMVP